MIDTKYLESIINAVLSDKNLIHYQIKKVGKNPDYISIEMVYIHTGTGESMMRILMGWEVSRFIRNAGSYHDATDSLSDRIREVALLSSSNTFRLKWFYSIVNKLNERGADKIAFTPNDFEFGAGIGCIWALMNVKVFEVQP